MNFRQRFRNLLRLSRDTERTREASTLLGVSEVAFSLRQPLPPLVLGIAMLLAMFVPFVILASEFGATVFDFSGLISGQGQDQVPHLLYGAPLGRHSQCLR